MNFLEILALEIKKPNTKLFLVFCWYRPPHSSVEHFEIFQSLLKQAEKKYRGSVIGNNLAFQKSLS